MARLTRIPLAALFTWLVAATCFAQDGVITGRITDSSGAALPGVNVSLTGTSIMAVRSAVSDEQGGYRFGLLPPGEYALKLELQGFNTVVREGVQLTAGFTSTLNLVMSLVFVLAVLGMQAVPCFYYFTYRALSGEQFRWYIVASMTGIAVTSLLACLVPMSLGLKSIKQLEI